MIYVSHIRESIWLPGSGLFYSMLTQSCLRPLSWILRGKKKTPFSTLWDPFKNSKLRWECGQLLLSTSSPTTELGVSSRPREPGTFCSNSKWENPGQSSRWIWELFKCRPTTVGISSPSFSCHCHQKQRSGDYFVVLCPLNLIVMKLMMEMWNQWALMNQHNCSA